MLRNRRYLTTSNQLQNVAGSLNTEKYGIKLVLGVHEYCCDLSGSFGVKTGFLNQLNNYRFLKKILQCEVGSTHMGKGRETS